MRAVLTGLLLFIVVVASAQTASLPTWVLDSLLYETKLGRQCSEVMKAQSIELQKQGQELAHVNKALSLSQSESKTLESLVSNARESNKIQGEQFAIDLGKEKRKKRKWRNGFFILVAVIAAREGLNTLD